MKCSRSCFYSLLFVCLSCVAFASPVFAGLSMPAASGENFIIAQSETSMTGDVSMSTVDVNTMYSDVDHRVLVLSDDPAIVAALIGMGYVVASCPPDCSQIDTDQSKHPSAPNSAMMGKTTDNCTVCHRKPPQRTRFAKPDNVALNVDNFLSRNDVRSFMPLVRN